MHLTSSCPCPRLMNIKMKLMLKQLPDHYYFFCSKPWVVEHLKCKLCHFNGRLNEGGFCSPCLGPELPVQRRL